MEGCNQQSRLLLDLGLRLIQKLELTPNSDFDTPEFSKEGFTELPPFYMFLTFEMSQPAPKSSDQVLTFSCWYRQPERFASAKPSLPAAPRTTLRLS